MPGPSGKRRFGSHRRVGQRVETPEDMFVADQSPVAQAEESAESLNILPHEGQVTLESHRMLSSEQKSSKRKLGSNRQSKRRSAESAVESYHKPTEDIEENVSTDKIEAQMIPAGQEASKLNDYDLLYGTHLYSAYTPGHTSESLNPSYPNDEEHQLLSSNLHSAQDAGELEHKWDTGSYELENTGKQLPDNQQLHDKFEFPTISDYMIGAEKRLANKDPPQPDKLWGDDLNAKSKETCFPAYPEENAPNKNTDYEIAEIKYNVEQPSLLSAIGNLPANEEHELSNFSQVRGAQLPDHFQITELKSTEYNQIDYTEVVEHEKNLDAYLENMTDETMEDNAARNTGSDDTNKEETITLKTFIQLTEMDNSDSFPVEEISDHDKENANLILSDPQLQRNLGISSDSGLNPQDNLRENPMREDPTEVSEHKFKNDHVSNPMETSNTENKDPTENKELDNDQEMSGQNAKDVSSTITESELSSGVQPEKGFVFNSHSDDNASADELADSFSPVAKTGEVDNHPVEIKELTFKNVKAELEEIEIKVMDNLDTFQGENTSELVRGNEHGVFSDFITSIIHSNTIIPQLINEQSHSRKIPEEQELSSAECQPIKDPAEENETLLQVPLHEKLEYAIEVGMPRNSLNEGGEITLSVMTAAISPPKADVSTDEKHENLSFSQDRAVEHQYKDLIEEAKPLETDQIKDSDILITGSKDDDENIDIIETLEASTSQFSIINPLDSDLNPQDNLKAHPMKEDTTEVSDQRFKNAHFSNLMETRINTEKTDPTENQEPDSDVQGISEQSAKEVSSAIIESELFSSVQPEKAFVFDSQSDDDNASADELTDSFNPVAKTGEVDNQPVEIKEVTLKNGKAELDIFEIKGMDNLNTFQGENTSELVRGNEHGVSSDFITSNTTIPQPINEQSHSRKIPEDQEFSNVECQPLTDSVEENETLSLVPQHENLEDAIEVGMPRSSLNEGGDITLKVVTAAISPPKADLSTDEKHENLSFSQDRAVERQYKDLIEEAKPSETDQIKDPDTLITGYKGEDENIDIETLEARRSQLSIINRLDSGLNPQDNLKEHPMNEGTTEVSDQRFKNAHSSHLMETKINTEKTDPTKNQELDNDGQGISEQSGKEVSSAIMESELSSNVQPEKGFVIDTQMGENNASADEQTDSFSNVAKTDFDSHPGEIKEITFKIQATESENFEIKGIDHLDTFQGENMNELVRGNEYGVFSEFITSSTTVLQPINEQSHSGKILDEEELFIVKSEIKSKEENGNLNANRGYLASQSHANAEVSIASPEMCTESSHIEDVEIRYNVVRAAISPPKAGVSTDEGHKNLCISQGTAVQQPQDNLVKDAKSFDTDQIGDSEIFPDKHEGEIYKNTGDVNEMMELHASKLSIMSSLDLGLNPQEKPKELPMKDSAANTMDKWVKTERTDTTKSQVSENEVKNQVISDVKEETTASEFSFKSPETEKGFIFDSQTDDNNACADEQTDSFSHVNRRKLGSSRRNKKRHIKVFSDELYSDFKDNATAKAKDDDYHGEITDVTLRVKTVEEEKSALKEKDILDTFQGGYMRDSDGAVSGFISLNSHSSTIAPQLLLDQLTATKLSEGEETPIVESKTKMAEENVQADLLNQPLIDAKVSIATLEMCTSKSSLKKHTEYSEAKATISSTKAETSIDGKHEHICFSEVKDAPNPNFISMKEHKLSETEQNEDSVILSPALNSRKLGSSQQDKGTHQKVFAAESHNESADDAAGKSSDEKDPSDDNNMTFTIKAAEMQNTQKNSLNENEDIACGPKKAIIPILQEEKCEQVRTPRDDSVQYMENNINKTVKEKMEVTELNHIDDPTTEVLKMEASEDFESNKELKMEGTQYTLDKASQECKNEKLEVEVSKSQVMLEDDSIPPNADKDEVAKISSHGEVPDVQCISNPHRIVCDISNMNVQESDEKFHVTNVKAVSLEEKSLEIVQEAGKDTKGKSVEGIRDSSERIGQVNLPLTPPKKRKMGSTRRSRINKKQDAEMHIEDYTTAMENVGVMEDVNEALQNQTTKSSLDEKKEFNTAEVNQELHRSASESNMIASTNDVMTAFSEHVSSHDAKGANRFTSQVAYVTGNDKDAVDSTEARNTDHVPVSEVHNVSSLDIERKKKQHINKGESLSEATEHETKGIEGQAATQITGGEHMKQQSNIQGINAEIDGASEKNGKNHSLTNKKRIGSKRRNLGTMSKGDLELKLDLSNEVPVTVLVHDVITESACQSDDKKLKPESLGSEPSKGNTGDPPSTVLAHGTGGENITAEHHLVQRDILEKDSITARPDVLSELELGGRKRKMGSHRKSRAQQTHVKQNEVNMMETETVRVSPTHKQADDIIQGPEELQGNESDTKPSIISESIRIKPTHEVTASQTLQDKVHLGPDTWNASYAGKSANLKGNPFNVIMVGDSCVGKTSFMKRAQNGKFFPDLPASAGLDTCLWTVVVDGKTVVLQLWDTAGQERFRSITKQILHRAHAFLLMYDITSSQSFTAVHYWASCIQEGAMENVPILLIGNKNDSVERQVTIEEGLNVAKEFKIDCMECSAVTGDNVIQSLEAVARLLSQKDDRREETLILHKEPPKKKLGCC
ncbi:uncharacterized protein rab44 isoform X3 [Corythoichthys intestinalis]|uniref:uncharacterized protein rab44 isoform X3 n=1 Tax=Corythoichthys intestinalis TaxID=161448 RepID=UPI0025A5148A|nr:uncharacterized protein rab44 isoform X3 [Corythoichthys intestinalis]